MNATTETYIIPRLRQYFKSQPIDKAWMFGSFSRGEETPESDLDIIVSFKDGQPIGLLRYARIYGELKELTGREIDLVEEGTLMPFALNAAEADKILIYEREN